MNTIIIIKNFCNNVTLTLTLHEPIGQLAFTNCISFFTFHCKNCVDLIYSIYAAIHYTAVWVKDESP